MKNQTVEKKNRRIKEDMKFLGYLKYKQWQRLSFSLPSAKGLRRKKLISDEIDV